MSASVPVTPTTPAKAFTLPMNPFQRNVTPSKSLDSGLDEVDADVKSGFGNISAGISSPRTPSRKIMRRRSNSIDAIHRKDEPLWTPGSATKTPMSSARPQNSVFGSIERGLDKMKVESISVLWRSFCFSLKHITIFISTIKLPFTVRRC